MASVAVLGSGSWGTALAIHLARLGNAVRLWARDPDTAARLRDAGEQAKCHPGVPFPPGLVPTADLEEACRAAAAVVVSCPSHAMRHLGTLVSPVLATGALVVSTAKGVEQDSHATMSDVLHALCAPPRR